MRVFKVGHQLVKLWEDTEADWPFLSPNEGFSHCKKFNHFLYYYIVFTRLAVKISGALAIASNNL